MTIKSGGALKHDDGEQHAGDIITLSYAGDVAGVKRVVESGVSINTTEDRTKFTPLHIAVGKAHLDLFNYLIDRDDIDLWAEDRWGRTAGVIALNNGNRYDFVGRIARKAEAVAGGEQPPSPGN